MNHRLEALRAQLRTQGLDAAFIAEPSNRRYLSGFTGTSGYVLAGLSEQWFLTDFRYVEQAKSQCPDFHVVNYGPSLVSALADLLQTAGVKSLAFEQDYLTYGEVQRYRELEERVPGLSLVPVSDLVESLRMVKDAEEIKRVEQAVAVADAAFEYILGVIQPGVTEKEVALELELFMRRQGASGPSFETIVASGWRSALPHGVASDKVIEDGEFVTLDFGAVVDGYCSDITRTVVVGQPTDRQREVYEHVRQANELALAQARPGLTGRDLDAVARDYLASHGLGEAFGHSLGHGVGLAIHELPRLSKQSDDRLARGMIVTIEPGVYLPGWGGVRIEDDIVLTDDGCRVLTHAGKDLMTVGK
ncbi:M24 family metallopeptidase [Alicyclobacillus shizuokensis]|uniref:M24 family metallopeptidase n=1 Tax=Alicyclobacillus shizuokensis TaxID=392014 RepID=UPI00082DD4EF|nr:aminopeptidase P family protein [Alicyclobacillus shizuokensis]MCL6625732.1 aminopeptidase P family protein [Alicyclobacillus shizuokensis]